MYNMFHSPYAYPEGHPDHDPEVTKALREHEKTWGGFNDTPPGWREITEEEFVRSNFFSYDPEKVEHRQLMHAGITDEKGTAPLHGARLYFFWDGTGVALMDDFWAGKIRFFAFGCKHKWREVYGDEVKKLGFGRLYSHDHALVCDECGRMKVVDSSG